MKRTLSYMIIGVVIAFISYLIANEYTESEWIPFLVLAVVLAFWGGTLAVKIKIGN